MPRWVKWYELDEDSSILRCSIAARWLFAAALPKVWWKDKPHSLLGCLVDEDRKPFSLRRLAAFSGLSLGATKAAADELVETGHWSRRSDGTLRVSNYRRFQHRRGVQQMNGCSANEQGSVQQMNTGVQQMNGCSANEQGSVQQMNTGVQQMNGSVQQMNTSVQQMNTPPVQQMNTPPAETAETSAKQAEEIRAPRARASEEVSDKEERERGEAPPSLRAEDFFGPDLGQDCHMRWHGAQDLADALQEIRPRWSPQRRLEWVGKLDQLLGEKDEVPREWIVERLHLDKPDSSDKPEWWWGRQMGLRRESDREKRRSRGVAPVTTVDPETDEWGAIIRP